MEHNEFNQYQMTAEKIKDDTLKENRRLLRQLAEKEQSFELVKMVHFDRNIDLKTLNDIIIGCTGCLHSVMFSNKKVITDLKENSEIYKIILQHRNELMSIQSLEVKRKLIAGYTIVVYPVGTSDLVEGHHHYIRSIVMLYPNRLMDDEVLAFVKSFMIVNEVLINIVLTRERMMELIETDPLTKAYNRLAWRESLKRYLYEQSAFFILFVDLDNFKNINDSYGHQKGDEILKFTAAWLKSIFRSDDKVFRLGGDEFAVAGFIDPNDEFGLEEKLASLNTNYVETVERFIKLRTTVSLGAFVTKGNLSEETVYAKVDELLYQSKENGRNTITVFSEI